MFVQGNATSWPEANVKWHFNLDDILLIHATSWFLNGKGSLTLRDYIIVLLEIILMFYKEIIYKGHDSLNSGKVIPKILFSIMNISFYKVLYVKLFIYKRLKGKQTFFLLLFYVLMCLKIEYVLCFKCIAFRYKILI